MTYSREDREITVKFTIPEYRELLAYLGFVLLHSKGKYPEVHRDMVRYITGIAQTNPDYKLLLGETVGTTSTTNEEN